MTLTYNGDFDWNEFQQSLKDEDYVCKTKEDFSKEKEFLSMLDNTIQKKKKNVTLTELDESNDNVAYTDMKGIFINFEKIAKTGLTYSQFLSVIKGANYHELSHILFTKYGYVSSDIANALNILEDSRIENIFTTIYPRSISYFKMLFLNQIIKSGQQASYQSYVLLYGRRFILENDKLLGNLRKIFVTQFNEAVAIEVEAIIDTYLVTKDVATQKVLARKLTDIIGSNNCPQPTSGYAQGRNERKGQSKEENDATEEMEKELKEEEKKKKKKQKDDKKGDAGTKADDKESDELSDKECSDLFNTEKDALNEIEKELEKSEASVKDDIERQMDRMDKHGFGSKGDVNNSRWVFTPEEKHKVISNKVLNLIKRMKNDLDNKTVYNQKRGRINLRRAMVNTGYQTNDFKRYIPSRLGKTKLGVSILVDASSSMSETEYNTAVASAWIIAKALEQTNSLTKVYEFSKDMHVIKDFSEQVKKANWGRVQRGGTYVLDTLNDAYKSTSALTKKLGVLNNVILIITDGQFDKNTEVEQLTAKLKDNGIYVALFKVGAASMYYSQNSAAAYSKIIKVNSFSELDKSMAEMVTHIQHEVVLKIKKDF